ncbi:unnamed protein product [Schistocephalus solidus]|uniref:Peptidase S1 domain-containing protein n=1 Tax=Schistocephalus solidus TaxID=70667 RepID=A0A183T2M7_SCHSO|nr:unnamed protein product [Schistocephalus solidus]
MPLGTEFRLAEDTDEALRVFVGDHDYTANGEFQEIYLVNRAIFNPNHNPDDIIKGTDIAILKTKDPITLIPVQETAVVVYSVHQKTSTVGSGTERYAADSRAAGESVLLSIISVRFIHG